MAEDWVAVGAAIKRRRLELKLTQVALAKKATVSKQVVYELEKAVERDRSPRTLSALSNALGWHDGHLAAISAGRLPLQAGDPVPTSDDDISGHISVVEQYMLRVLAEMQTIHVRVDDILAKVDDVHERTQPDPRRR